MTSEQNSDRTKPLEDMAALFMTELEELNVDEVHKSNERYAEKRAYVRMIFAFIEGITYMIKQYALTCNPQVFTREEIAILEEESYALNEKGKAIIKPLKINTSNNIIFAFNSLAKSEGVEYKLDTSNHMWQRLNEALRVRHRLTHPKSVESLNITTEELRAVGEGASFYYEIFMEILQLIEAKEDQQNLDGETVD